MARCTRITNLEVHHIDRTGGNDPGNARVLCQQCHEATGSYGQPGPTPPAFTEATKEYALGFAGNQCECERTSGCH